MARLTEKRAAAVLAVAAIAEADADAFQESPEDEEHAEKLRLGVEWIRSYIWQRAERSNWHRIHPFTLRTPSPTP